MAVSTYDINGFGRWHITPANRFNTNAKRLQRYATAKGLPLPDNIKNLSKSAVGLQTPDGLSREGAQQIVDAIEEFNDHHFWQIYTGPNGRKAQANFNARITKPLTYEEKIDGFLNDAKNEDYVKEGTHQEDLKAALKSALQGNIPTRPLSFEDRDLLLNLLKKQAENTDLGKEKKFNAVQINKITGKLGLGENEASEIEKVETFKEYLKSQPDFKKDAFVFGEALENAVIQGSSSDDILEDHQVKRLNRALRGYQGQALGAYKFNGDQLEVINDLIGLDLNLRKSPEERVRNFQRHLLRNGVDNVTAQNFSKNIKDCMQGGASIELDLSHEEKRSLKDHVDQYTKECSKNVAFSLIELNSINKALNRQGKTQDDRLNAFGKFLRAENLTTEDEVERNTENVRKILTNKNAEISDEDRAELGEKRQVLKEIFTPQEAASIEAFLDTKQTKSYDEKKGRFENFVQNVYGQTDQGPLVTIVNNAFQNGNDPLLDNSQKAIALQIIKAFNEAEGPDGFAFDKNQMILLEGALKETPVQKMHADPEYGKWLSTLPSSVRTTLNAKSLSDLYQAKSAIMINPDADKKNLNVFEQRAEESILADAPKSSKNLLPENDESLSLRLSAIVDGLPKGHVFKSNEERSRLKIERDSDKDTFKIDGEEAFVMEKQTGKMVMSNLSDLSLDLALATAKNQNTIYEQEHSPRITQKVMLGGDDIFLTQAVKRAAHIGIDYKNLGGIDLNKFQQVYDDAKKSVTQNTKTAPSRSIFSWRA
jgi:hypothetical protein